jgi:hypothetical protein
MRDMHLINRQELSELTSRLVAIDSANPMLVPGGAGEHEIARFVAGWAGDAPEGHVAMPEFAVEIRAELDRREADR